MVTHNPLKTAERVLPIVTMIEPDGTERDATADELDTLSRDARTYIDILDALGEVAGDHGQTESALECVRRLVREHKERRHV